MWKQISCPFLFVFLLASWGRAQTTYTIATVPNPKDRGAGYISDPDDYLRPDEEAAINQILAALEDSSSAQVAVALLASIGAENPKDFATRLFQHWGIGQAQTDNGLLILSVLDQRRTEFETGYGLEAVLPDAYCYRIGMQELVPYFKEEQYGQGLLAAVKAIAEILQDPASLPDIQTTEPLGRKAPREIRSPRWWFGMPPFLRGYLFINLLFHFGLLLWLLFTYWSKEELYDRYLRIRKVTHFWLGILFPLPYLPLFFLLRKMAKSLRDKPRYSKVNGKLMHRLSEEEDDHFLEKGQITEEEIESVDYDVWVTEEEDDVLILRYKKKFSKYSACPKCKFLTYHLTHTHVIRHATYDHSGKKELTYECKNCHYKDVQYQTIPKKEHSSSSGGGSWGGGGGGGSFGGGSSGGGGAGVSW
jgi:uncharacterized protein